MLFEAQAVPLRADEDKIIRVGSTRVTLSTIAHAFNQGYTAEEIVTDFPALQLADVYGVIAYILNNRDAVAAYLAEQEDAAESVRQEIEARSDSRQFRERLLARAQAADSPLAQ
jgi:hypothetical protein